MFLRKCPSSTDLEAFAVHEGAGGRIGRHIAGCPACANIVSMLREENKFTEELRAAAAESTPESVLTRLRALSFDPTWNDGSSDTSPEA